MACFNIEVTQEDIDNGEPGGIYSCPIAESLKREFGSSICVVGQKTCTVGSATIWLSDNVTRFINDFDNGEPVQPFSFLLEVEDDAIQADLLQVSGSASP